MSARQSRQKPDIDWLLHCVASPDERGRGDSSGDRLAPGGAGKCAAGTRDIGGIDPGMRRKGEQQRFLGAEVIENAGQEFGLRRGITKLLWGNARGHQEALKAPLIFGQKCQSLNGQKLGLLPALLSARASLRVKRHSVAVSEYAPARLSQKISIPTNCAVLWS
jgi:hypothetical protein